MNIFLVFFFIICIPFKPILKLRKDNEDLKDSIYELRISNLEKTIQGYSDLEDELDK